MEKRKKQITDKLIDKMTNSVAAEEFDPNGMYTGVPADPNEAPVQDADDL